MATSVLRVSFGSGEDFTRTGQLLRFGDIAIDLAAREVRAGLRLSRIEPRAAAVLGALVARPGQVVTRVALLDACWPDDAGSDEALTQTIAQLRRALVDDPKAPACIATVPKAGYRWIALAGPTARPRRRPWPIAAGLAATALLGGGITAAGLAAFAPEPPRQIHVVQILDDADGSLPPLPPLPSPR